MFKILFLKDTKVDFLDPKTGKKEWYGSDYWRGTSMEVADILSGNSTTIHAKCLDGETAVLETEAVQIERENVRRSGSLLGLNDGTVGKTGEGKHEVQRPESPTVTRRDVPVAVVQKKHQRQTPGTPGRDSRVQVYRSDK